MTIAQSTPSSFGCVPHPPLTQQHVRMFPPCQEFHHEEAKARLRVEKSGVLFLLLYGFQLNSTRKIGTFFSAERQVAKSRNFALGVGGFVQRARLASVCNLPFLGLRKAKGKPAMVGVPIPVLELSKGLSTSDCPVALLVIRLITP